MIEGAPWITVGLTAGISAASTIIAVIVTSILTRRREHDSDWRKFKLSQYQEFILALSGVVNERANHEARCRYADAVNSMNLVGSSKVFMALMNFQKEISYKNTNRTNDRHDQFLAVLIREMRKDVHPKWSVEKSILPFRVLSIPPTSDVGTNQGH